MPKQNTTWGATSMLLALQQREGSRDLPFALYLWSSDCVGMYHGYIHTFLCSARNSDRANHIRFFGARNIKC